MPKSSAEPVVVATTNDTYENGRDKANASSSSSLKKYTWQQVAEHSTEASCWVSINKKVYDITSWLNQHPGGKEMLLLIAGRDATDMFVSYHPFTNKPQQVLSKFLIGEIQDLEFPSYRDDTGFYRELCQKVNQYFLDTQQSPKDPRPGLIRLACILIVAFWSFSVAYDNSRHWLWRILAAQLFGVCQALPLLHSMHDASHTSIGSNPWYWRIIGRLTMDWFAGASLTSWHNQHIIGHHVYTNVMGADPDLPVTERGDIRRVTRLQYWSWPYQFQHVYLLFLYGLLALKFRVQDIVGLVTKSNGPMRVNVTTYECVWQFVVKVWWAMWRIVLPLYVWKISSDEFILLFLISEFVTGYYLTFNFQVSHISPQAIFPDIKNDKFDEEWAISQVKTTIDYAHGDSVMTFLCGALNYQTVHHLFPSVSQYHYPAIAPIIMNVCKKYNIQYNVLPTFYDAFKCHVQHLKEMGVKALDDH